MLPADPEHKIHSHDVILLCRTHPNLSYVNFTTSQTRINKIMG